MDISITKERERETFSVLWRKNNVDEELKVIEMWQNFGVLPHNADPQKRVKQAVVFSQKHGMGHGVTTAFADSHPLHANSRKTLYFRMFHIPGAEFYDPVRLFSTSIKTLVSARRPDDPETMIMILENPRFVTKAYHRFFMKYGFVMVGMNARAQPIYERSLLLK